MCICYMYRVRVVHIVSALHIVCICYMYRLLVVHIVNNIIYRAAGPMRNMGFTVEEFTVAALSTVHIV
jgi:hypothetical protein